MGPQPLSRLVEAHGKVCWMAEANSETLAHRGKGGAVVGRAQA